MFLRNERATRIGLFIGTACAPFAAWRIYERISPLPAPLSAVRFPLAARYHIHRALWSSELETKGYHLDQAMRRVLAAGLGAASPQSTALVVYLSQLYLEAEPLDLDSLRASFAALTHKPHVGEGIAEERQRLEMAFKVADKLCKGLVERGGKQEAMDYATRVLTILDKAPPFLKNNWTDYPLRRNFESCCER